MSILIFTIILIAAIAMLAFGTYMSCNDADASFFIIASAMAFCAIMTIYIYTSNELDNKSKIHYYKVKELERNTMFTITDSIGGYNNIQKNTTISGRTELYADTIWVNMNTLKIDTKDSTAMMCVIINEIE